MRLCGTFWRTCTTARHVLAVKLFAQSGHWWYATTYSTSKVCCRMAPWNASCWIVIFTLIRLEWGSVQIKLASMILTFERPLNFRRHNANNSLDSGEAEIQCAGGCSHRSQLKKHIASDTNKVYMRLRGHSLSTNV